MKKKISILIRKSIEDYRSANASAIAANLGSKSHKAFSDMRTKASGAIDTLYKLDPENPLWAEMEWANC